MFIVHSPYPWVSPEVNTGIFKTTISYISGMVAPVFLFLAGIAICMVANKVRKQGLDEQLVRRKMIARGAGIVLAGYLLQVSFWVFGGFSADPIRMLKVDILQCIGTSMVLLTLVAWPGKGMFQWRAIMMFFVMVLGAQLTWRLPLGEWMPDAVAGYFTHMYRWARFPIFPYGGWLALGLIVGPIWLHMKITPGGERRFWMGLATAALAALVMSWTILWIEKTLGGGGPVGAGRDGFKTSVNYFFYKIAWLFVLFSAARLTASLLDKIPGDWLTMLGRASLFAYCVHLALVYYVFGVLWKQSLSSIEYIFAVVLLTAVMFALSFAWLRWPPVNFLKGEWVKLKGVYDRVC